MQLVKMPNNIIPYNDSRSLGFPGHFTSDRGASIEAIIGAWLHSKKEGKSNSLKTEKAYKETVKAFRDMLLADNHDLIWHGDDFVPTIADYAQIFASLRSEKSRRKGSVGRATINHRLAVLSSFYAFAIKRGHIKPGNPIDMLDRPKVQAYAQAQAIEQEEVEARLKEIDPETIQGARDLAMLSVLLSTGRRVSEVATLKRENLHLTGKQIKVVFEHTKGDEVMQDLLSIPVTKVLRAWLEMFYTVPLKDLPADRPLWVNVHHQSHYGEPLGYHGVSGICQHYLGTSKVHVTRHTFAILMELAGAKLTDIQKRLGHKNAATTGTYMDKLTQDRNPFAEKIASMLGLENEE